MKKALLVGCVLGICSAWAGATTFSEDFESGLNSALWAAGGNANYSYVTSNGSANDYLGLVTGGWMWQSASYTTMENGLGFNNALGRKYSVDILGSTITEDNCKVRFGVINGAGWWDSTSGFIFEFVNSNARLMYKDNDSYGSHDGHTLFYTNYTGIPTHIEFTVTNTTYSATIDGLGGTWNTSGALSGNHGMQNPSSSGKLLLEIQNWDPYSNPFNVQFDNVYSAPAPEPATVGLLTLGALMLRRRK